MARTAGVPVLAMVSSVADARRAVAAGADGVIAQGTESGGHRSIFADGETVRSAPEIGTLALVPQMVDAVGDTVPVVASGGIMDGRGIAAALVLGAAGVSLGTRFLGTRESGDRRRLPPRRWPTRSGTARSSPTPSRVARRAGSTTASSRRWSRPTWARWAGAPRPRSIADVRREAARQNAVDLLPMLAGQAAALVGEPLPAADVVARLVDQTRAALQR